MAKYKLKFDNLTPQEEALYLSIRACKKKTGIKVADLRDAFPDICKTRMSDLLRHLQTKGAIKKVSPAFYTAG